MLCFVYTLFMPTTSRPARKTTRAKARGYDNKRIRKNDLLDELICYCYLFQSEIICCSTNSAIEPIRNFDQRPCPGARRCDSSRERKQKRKTLCRSVRISPESDIIDGCKLYIIYCFESR